MIARCHRRNSGARAKSLGLEFRIYQLADISGVSNWQLLDQAQPKSIHCLNHIKLWGKKKKVALGANI